MEWHQNYIDPDIYDAATDGRERITLAEIEALADGPVNRRQAKRELGKRGWVRRGREYVKGSLRDLGRAVRISDPLVVMHAIGGRESASYREIIEAVGIRLNRADLAKIMDTLGYRFERKTSRWRMNMARMGPMTSTLYIATHLGITEEEARAGVVAAFPEEFSVWKSATIRLDSGKALAVIKYLLDRGIGSKPESRRGPITHRPPEGTGKRVRKIFMLDEATIAKIKKYADGNESRYIEKIILDHITKEEAGKCN
jgi:hypothetical protein